MALHILVVRKIPCRCPLAVTNAPETFLTLGTRLTQHT
jgi:hypothetical protein